MVGWKRLNRKICEILCYANKTISKNYIKKLYKKINAIKLVLSKRAKEVNYFDSTH